MRPRILLFLTSGFVILVLLICGASEISWSTKESTPDTLRQTVGLPSVAIGNLNPSARNPGLELLCTGLYDTPGGYCSYFSLGVSYINFTVAGNFTIGEK